MSYYDAADYALAGLERDEEESISSHAELGEVEALKSENKLLHNILDDMNAVLWENFMIKDKQIDIDFVRKEMIKLLEKWASI